MYKRFKERNIKQATTLIPKGTTDSETNKHMEEKKPMEEALLIEEVPKPISPCQKLEKSENNNASVIIFFQIILLILIIIILIFLIWIAVTLNNHQ